MDAHYYNVNLAWTADRKGEISSPELNDNVEVATPPQFNKGMEGIWSPEHLLTAAVNSCLMPLNTGRQIKDSKIKVFKCVENILPIVEIRSAHNEAWPFRVFWVLLTEFGPAPQRLLRIEVHADYFGTGARCCNEDM